MKLLKWILCISLCLLGELHSLNIDSEYEISQLRCFGEAVLSMSPQTPKIAMLTYPRTGSHWLSYIFTKVTDRFLTMTDRPWHNFGIYPLIPSIVASHNPALLVESSLNMEALTIIRNPHEALMRNIGVKNYLDLPKLYLKETLNYKEQRAVQRFELYFSILQAFDDWEDKQNFPVFYEDLIMNPEVEITRIATRYAKSLDKVNDFMKNYEKHKSFVLSFYDRKNSNNSKTKGEDVLFFSRQLTREQLLEMEKFIKCKYSYLFEKYLKRYLVNKNYFSE